MIFPRNGGVPMVREAFSRHEKNADLSDEKILQTLRFLDLARPAEARE